MRSRARGAPAAGSRSCRVRPAARWIPGRRWLPSPLCLLDQVSHRDWLRAVRARAAGAGAAGEGGAVGAALLAEEALPAVGAFVDGVLAAPPGGGHGDRDGLVLVATPGPRLAAPVAAVPPPARRRATGPACPD